MKVRLVLLLVAACAAALAQRSAGYVYAAPGAVVDGGPAVATLQFGVGGEGVVGKGFTLGADIGAVGPREELIYSLGVFSPGVYYHFVRGTRARFDPFVSGGYTLMFRGDHASFAHAGAGFNYWFRPRLALRVEVRDQFRPDYGRVAHFAGVRIGVSFR